MKETVGLLGAFHGEHGGTQLGHTFCYFFAFLLALVLFMGDWDIFCPFFLVEWGMLGRLCVLWRTSGTCVGGGRPSNKGD